MVGHDLTKNKLSDESEYEGSNIDVEDIQAIETMLYIGTGEKHYRAKMKSLAERCKDPRRGRLIDSKYDYWLGIDVYGNPEIRTQGGHSTIARFLTHSIRVCHNFLSSVSPYFTGANTSANIITFYTDYVWEGWPHQSYMLSSWKGQIEDYPSHHTGYGEVDMARLESLNDGCPVCKENEGYFKKLKEQNQRYIDKLSELKVKKADIDMFEFPIRENKLYSSDLVTWIHYEYQAVMEKRGWKRKSGNRSEILKDVV